jgi:type III secretory pathway component EscU
MSAIHTATAIRRMVEIAIALAFRRIDMPRGVIIANGCEDAVSQVCRLSEGGGACWRG